MTFFYQKTYAPSNIELIKENYQRRVLQIYVEMQNNPAFEEREINKRISRDPTIAYVIVMLTIFHTTDKNVFLKFIDPFKKRSIR